MAMLEDNKILLENEKQANRIVAKVMGTTFLIFTLIYLLNVCGVFVIRATIMTTAYILSSCLLLLPKKPYPFWGLKKILF